MSRFMKAVAVMATVVLGTLPGAMVVCQWACASGVTAMADEAAAHHHHAASPASADLSDTTIGAPGRACDHDADVLAAVAAAAPFKVLAPAAVHIAVTGGVHPGANTAPPVECGAHSPPGARSAPIPLRI